VRHRDASKVTGRGDSYCPCIMSTAPKGGKRFQGSIKPKPGPPHHPPQGHRGAEMEEYRTKTLTSRSRPHCPRSPAHVTTPATKRGLHSGREWAERGERKGKDSVWGSPRLSRILLHLDSSRAGDAGQAGRKLTPAAEVIPKRRAIRSTAIGSPLLSAANGSRES
jgi:hypothetical protein